MSTTLAEIFSKKGRRQRMVDAMKIKDSQVDPLYEWSLNSFDEDSHPFLPLGLSLTYARLIEAFLHRTSPPAAANEAAAAASTEGGGDNTAKAASTNDVSTTEKKKQEETKEIKAEKVKSAPPPVPVRPSIDDDPSVAPEDRIGTLLRAEGSKNSKLPRLQLTAKVAESLQGLVNDLMEVLKVIKDKTEDILAITTILEKARALLPESKDEKCDVFGKLLVEESAGEAKRKQDQKLFVIYADLVLGWAAEKVRRATEAYHDFLWLCDQCQLSTTDPVPRRTAWKAAVLWKTAAQNQDANQTYASRRYALLAACAAVGLWKSHDILEEGAGSSNSNGNQEEETKKENSDPPAAKRPRLDETSNADASLAAVQKLVDELEGAAGTESAFTRWIGGAGGRSCGRWKIASDIKAEEIQQAMLNLAHIMLIASKVYDVDNNNNNEPAGTPRVTDNALWWQALSQTLTKLPEKEEWESLVDDLYFRQFQPCETGKTVAQNIQSLHEFDLIKYEAKVESEDNQPAVRLVDKVSWESPIGTNPVTDSIVSRGGVGAEAGKMEKRIMEPSVELIRKRASIPAVYSEGMELNEWAVRLLYLDDVEPTPELVDLLTGALPGKKSSWQDLMPKLVNKSLLLLLQESLTAKVGRKASVTINSNGRVVVQGEMTHDKALCKAIVAFFYHSLESILAQEDGAPVKDDKFLRAILTCCMTCVVQAVGSTHKIHPKVKDVPVYSFMQMTESTPMSFLHYAPLFRESLVSPDNPSKFPLPQGLPRRIQRDFHQAEMAVLDTMLWAKDPNFENVLPDRADDLIETTDKNCCWWPVKVLIDETEEGAENIKYPSAKEDTYYLEIYHNLSVLMGRVLEVSYVRMEQVCRALRVAHWRLLLKYAWQTFRYFLRQHIKLFYDRHIDHWIITTIYGVAKRMKFDPEINFNSTIKAYVEVRGPEVGDSQCHRIMRHVKIGTNEGSSQLGHVILLYNKVFVPAMRSHLLGSEDLKDAAERLAKAAGREQTPLNLPEVTPTDPAATRGDEQEDEPMADAQDVPTKDLPKDEPLNVRSG